MRIVQTLSVYLSIFAVLSGSVSRADEIKFSLRSGNIDSESASASLASDRGVGTYLMQFDTAATPAERRQILASVQGTLGPWLPESAAIVDLPSGAAGVLRSRGFDVFPFLADWKLDPALDVHDQDRPYAREVLVTLTPWGTVQQMENHLAALGLALIESPGSTIRRATLRVHSPLDGGRCPYRVA